MSTILIVEDNRANMLLFSDLLSYHGHRILGASTGMEGLALARAHSPDLILMDIQLPDISGLELINALRTEERFRNTPIIAVTASVMPGEQAGIRTAGFDAVIEKPIDFDGFLATVERHCGAGTEPAAR